MESQKATLGNPQVTRTAIAMTNAVMNRADQASTLFFENLLAKNPAGKNIST